MSERMETVEGCPTCGKPCPYESERELASTVDRLRRERDEARAVIDVARKTHDENVAMRPVVEAAIEWRRAGLLRNLNGIDGPSDSWKRAVDGLLQAVDAYRAARKEWA